MSDATPSTSTTLPFQVQIRKSAFFDAVRRHGCHSFGVYNRTYISMAFHDSETEYRDLLDGAVLWPAGGERQVEVTGPDAHRFVQLLTPRNLDANDGNPRCGRSRSHYCAGESDVTSGRGPR